MKILITGASGSVGSGVTEPLSQNHDIILSDYIPVQSTYTFYQADVRKVGALNKASEGIDIIIHTPAYHGIHMGMHSEQEFYDLNITGTFQMFQSAVQNNVRRVVWLSSMSFYGTDFYAYTKKVGEQICQYFHEKHGIEVIMLRPADFTPFRDHLHYGERMLHGGVDRRDVIQAVMLAIECKQTFGAYRIVREDPFTGKDIEEYRSSPIEVWDRVFPGAKNIIETYKFKLPSKINLPDLLKEKQELGYRPKYNFGTFIQEISKDREISIK